VTVPGYPGYSGLSKFWRDSTNKHKSAFKKAWKRFEGTFKEAAKA